MFEAEYKQMMDGIAPTQELISDTLAKAQAAAQDKRPGRQIKGSLILAAVLILGLIGVTAIALTSPKLVNWSGNTVPGHAGAWNTTRNIADADHQMVSSMMDQAPENEIWEVDFPDGGQTIRYPSKRFASMEEMSQYIKEADQGILVPEAFPKGYQYIAGNVVFFASYKTLRAGITQLPTQTLASGTTIQRQKVAGPFQKDISSYYIGMKDNKGNVLDFYFRRNEATVSDSTRFFVLEGGSSETPEFPGMEKALYVNMPTAWYNHALHLRQADTQQKEWYEWSLLEHFDPRYAMPADDETKRMYAYAQYSLCSTALDKDQLLKIAEDLR